jgi:hypothetical protein
MTYSDFLEWNKKCFDEANDETKTFVRALCKSFSIVKIVDMETTASFSACSFFFDMSKKVCVVAPR